MWVLGLSMSCLSEEVPWPLNKNSPTLQKVVKKITLKKIKVIKSRINAV